MDLDAQIAVVVAYLADPRNASTAAAFHALADSLAGVQRPRDVDQGDQADDGTTKSDRKPRR